MEHGFFFHRIIVGAIRNIMRRKGWPFPAQGGRPKGDLEQIETKLSERGSGNTRRDKPPVKADPPAKETKVKRGGYIHGRMAVITGIAAAVVGLWMALAPKKPATKASVGA